MPITVKLREIVPDGSSYAMSVWRLSDGTPQLMYITQAEYDDFVVTRGAIGEPAGKPTPDAVFLMASGGMPNFTTGRPQCGDFWVRDEATREVVLFADNDPEWHYAQTVASEPVNRASRETGNVYGTANNSYTFTLTKALLTRLRAGTLTRTLGQVSIVNNVVTIPDGYIKRLEATIDRIIPNHRSVTFDAATSASNSYGTSLTISHTVAVQSNLAMLAGMGIRQVNITNMKYNAVTMTALDSNYWVGASDARVNGAKLVAPATGTHNWVGTAASSAQIGGAVLSAYGVDQTTPVSNSNKAGNSGSTSPSVTCTSATDELVFSFLGWHRGNTSMTDTLDGSWTQITQQIGDGYLGTSGAYITGASSVTRTDTLSTSKQWAILAYSLKAASAGVSFIAAPFKRNPQAVNRASRY